MSRIFVIRCMMILAFAFSSQGLLSQTCCSGGVPISGSIGMPVSSVGSFQINISYDYNYLGKLKSGTLLLEESNRRRTTQSVLLNASYALGNNFSVEMFSSYIRQDRYIENGTATNHDYTSGIGDAAVLFRFSKDNLSFRRGSILFGLGPKIPLGKTDLENDSGIVLNPDMQPGSGSWDLVNYFQYSISVFENRSLRAFIRASYNLRGSNNKYLETQTYKTGDELTAELGVSDLISIGSTMWNYSISTRIRQSSSDIIDNSDLPNTGGSWIYGSASLGYNISSTLLFHFTAELPVYSNPEGTQLSNSHRFNIGIFKNFGNDYSSIILK